jgi:hypothetical protein
VFSITLLNHPNNGNCYWNIIGFEAVKGRRNRNYEVVVLLFFDFSILGSRGNLTSSLNVLFLGVTS